MGALRFVERIAAFCAKMDVASEHGMRRDDLRPDMRVIGFERRAIVTFTVGDDRVTARRIFCGGRDWERDSG